MSARQGQGMVLLCGPPAHSGGKGGRGRVLVVLVSRGDGVMCRDSPSPSVSRGTGARPRRNQGRNVSVCKRVVHGRLPGIGRRLSPSERESCHL